MALAKSGPARLAPGPVVWYVVLVYMMVFDNPVLILLREDAVQRRLANPEMVAKLDVNVADK